MYNIYLVTLGFLIFVISFVQIGSQRYITGAILRDIEDTPLAIPAFSGLLYGVVSDWSVVSNLGIAVVIIAMIRMIIVNNRCPGFDYENANHPTVVNSNKELLTIIIGFTLVGISYMSQMLASYATNEIWVRILSEGTTNELSKNLSKKLIDIKNCWNISIAFGFLIIGISFIKIVVSKLYKKRQSGSVIAE